MGLLQPMLTWSVTSGRPADLIFAWLILLQAGGERSRFCLVYLAVQLGHLSGQSDVRPVGQRTSTAGLRSGFLTVADLMETRQNRSQYSDGCSGLPNLVWCRHSNQDLKNDLFRSSHVDVTQ